MQDTVDNVLTCVKPILPGVFPESGEYSVVEWGIVFRCEKKTVAKWVKDRKIPHRKYPGDEIWVRAEAMRSAFPEVAWE